jgi:hypothetical protein
LTKKEEGGPFAQTCVWLCVCVQSNEWVLLNASVSDKNGLLKRASSSSAAGKGKGNGKGSSSVTLFLTLSHQCEVDYFFFSKASMP